MNQENITNIINNLYDKYASYPDKRYLEALKAIENAYLNLGQDEFVLHSYSRALVEDYETKQEQLLEAFMQRDFDKIGNIARDLQSSVRMAVDENMLSQILKMEDCSKKKEFSAIYSAWMSFHENILPLFSILRFISKK